MSYMDRVATLLSGGSAARPVAILYHADAEWAGDAMPIERVTADLTRAVEDAEGVWDEENDRLKALNEAAREISERTRRAGEEY